MMNNFRFDSRIALTLDAGGTSFRFSAIRGGEEVTERVTVPTNGTHLDDCLASIASGFEKVLSLCPEPPVAISFAFPGPADYPAGIIGDLPNLPAFRGGVALEPMLREKFGIPVYINNDGDLFTYGEAIGGMLPHVNELLENAGSPKRYRNLFGVTLGTGLGGGIVSDGRLFPGDNSMAGEIWLMRNKLDPTWNAEEDACIRAVRRIYEQKTGIAYDAVPEPKESFEIACGEAPGNREAAVEAFRRLGEVTGDVIGNALTLLDGLVVIGGGVAGAWPVFLPALVGELNSTYTNPKEDTFRRLASSAFNLEDPGQLADFLKGGARRISVPGSDIQIDYDPLARVGVGISRLGTSEAIQLGAYAFALAQLNLEKIHS